MWSSERISDYGKTRSVALQAVWQRGFNEAALCSQYSDRPFAWTFWTQFWRLLRGTQFMWDSRELLFRVGCFSCPKRRMGKPWRDHLNVVSENPRTDDSAIGQEKGP